MAKIQVLEIKGLLISIENNVWELGIKTVQEVRNQESNDKRIELLREALEAIKIIKNKLKYSLDDEEVKELKEYKNILEALEKVRTSLGENLESALELKMLENMLKSIQQ